MNVSRTLIPDLVVLQAFECAARHGSFTQAAAELHLTQSAVSRQIRALEVQLGVTLFERVRRHVVLSETGRSLLPSVMRLLAQSEALVQQAMASADGRIVLSIAALPTFTSRWLLPRLADFTAHHPDIVVNIASHSERFDLVEQDFDLAIHYGQPVWARASCTYLCSEVILPVASPALIASHPVAAIDDFTGTPLLHLATRPRQWVDWFEQNGGTGAIGYHGHRFDQFNMIIEAAIIGLGFALLPKYLIEEELSSGRLQIVLDRSMTTENNYYLVTPEGKSDSGAAKAFEAWILSQVSPISR
ncbi:LysR family transcriptional regulator [Hoeflea sp. YIM 152468]|uniref:LysR family transcriptional regulator n=1 Tax=Hoeflea sp. YIM 152468 TaxID=3031759 RepID=UPI0023DA7B78|nr:LysR family transcriptional regulator [Hoeflea sp. YIM 152468]MDF1608666.1 LysR family transcriptional regulator [Hoeflea sp. YIM 152468]